MQVVDLPKPVALLASCAIPANTRQPDVKYVKLAEAANAALH
jgi:hypothetical protein